MASDRLKVCMIAYTSYPFDNRVRREAETLAAQGRYDVMLLVPKDGAVPKTYSLDGVTVKEHNMRQYQGKSKINYMLSYCLFVFLASFSFSKLFFLRKLDIIHVHNMPDFLVFAAILPRMFGTKMILDVHDSMPETYAAKFNHGSGNLLFRIMCLEEALCCRIAHRVICVNHTQRDVLVARGIDPRKIEISINVPDHNRFRAREVKTADMAAAPCRMVYHGTLVKRLGVDLIIRAVARLVQKCPDLEFHLYGGGDDKEEFKKLSIELNLQKVVFFHKGVPLDELVKIIADMDIGIVGNRKNIATALMLPVKMLEYVALEIPVITPRLKAIQYYFKDDMVCFYDSEDIDSMAQAIETLYFDSEQRRAKAHQAKQFLKQYGWEIHQKDLLRLYDSLKPSV
jgi:glycosyltransferase involved in cell wall biosynthesis